MRTHRQHKQEEYPRRDAAGFHAQFGSGAAGLPPGQKRPHEGNF